MVPELGGNWQLALGLVFLSGVIFFILSITPAREWLVNAIPMNLKLGIAAGIGLFLALVGFENAGMITADPSTLVKLGDMGQAQVLLAGAGFMLIAGLAAQRIPGAIIIGVLAVTFLAVLFGLQHSKASPPRRHRSRRLSSRWICLAH
jgi:AGZA family xanthine/uracil permease-like MFS transporter